MAHTIQQVIDVVRAAERLKIALEGAPDLDSVAREVLNGHIAPGADRPRMGTGKKPISEETRAKMRAAAAKRWGKKGRKNSGGD